MTWTRFMDMHSGGGLKEPPYDKILIQASQDEAEVIFYNRFGHNPNRVTCTCCGEDYSISDGESLADLTAYDRNCAIEYFDVETDESFGQLDYSDIKNDYSDRKYKALYKGREVTSRYVEKPDLKLMKYGASRKECEDRYMTLTEYLKSGTVLVIEEKDIRDSERIGSLPEQGYVWTD